MKYLIYVFALYTFAVQNTGSGRVQSAAIICDENKSVKITEGDRLDNRTSHHYYQTAEENDVSKFLHKIQCSLERVKPWMDELQQEAKRLEQAAKRLGIGILNSFGEFINKLAEEDTENSQVHNGANGNITEGNGNTTTEADAVTEKISEFLCPDGFVADINGICERIEQENLI